LLKVYNRKTYVSINGEPWEQIGWIKQIMSSDNPTETVIFENKTFKECFEYLGNHYVCGLDREYTVFRNKPAVLINYTGDLSLTCYKHFDTISCKYVYKENSNISLNEIMKDFSADECIQYLKERGITACPILSK
jgi:hypothetical protein